MRAELTKLELRMRQALLKEEGLRVQKKWLLSKRKNGATLLVGTLQRSAYTVCDKITFSKERIVFLQPYDPLK